MTMEIIEIQKKSRQKSTRGYVLHEMLNKLVEMNHVSHNDTSFIIFSILSHNNINVSDLVRFSTHTNWLYRSAVASNKKTPKTTLISLSNETHSMILKSLASNKKTPKEILGKLAKIKGTHNFNEGEYLNFIQYEVAKNTNTDEKTLHFLAKMNNSDIVSKVLYNPSTAIETIKFIGTLNFRGAKTYSNRVLKQRLN